MQIQELLELLLFAAIAGGVLFYLYAILGKRVGRQPEDAPAPAAAAPKMLDARTPSLDSSEGVALAGLAAVRAQDPSFEIDVFLRGARTAYETIVKAFAANDRQTLKPLVSPDVYPTFDTAIAEREKAGIAEAVEFLNPARADLETADIEGDQVRIRVRFLSEFRSVPKGDANRPEVKAGERRAAEVWTFGRPADSRDPNWILARVEAAQA